MSMCTIRVELHDASWVDYTNLSTYLRNNGITDIIVTDTGKRYKMSPGHYTYNGPKTFDQVYDDAVSCAARVGKRYAVTASHVTANKWVGLSPVQPQ